MVTWQGWSPPGARSSAPTGGWRGRSAGWCPARAAPWRAAGGQGGVGWELVSVRLALVRCGLVCGRLNGVGACLWYAGLLCCMHGGQLEAKMAAGAAVLGATTPDEGTRHVAPCPRCRPRAPLFGTALHFAPAAVGLPHCASACGGACAFLLAQRTLLLPPTLCAAQRPAVEPAQHAHGLWRPGQHQQRHRGGRDPR